jgi:hypothetical protein
VAHNKKGPKVYTQGPRYFSKCETLKASVRFAAALCEISGSILALHIFRLMHQEPHSTVCVLPLAPWPQAPVPSSPVVGATAAH